MPVSDGLRAETHARIRRLSVEERVRLAFRLSDEDVDLFCAAHACSAEHARATFRRARSLGRRPSIANESNRR